MLFLLFGYLFTYKDKVHPGNAKLPALIYWTIKSDHRLQSSLNPMDVSAVPLQKITKYMHVFVR
jgi:hypothetical protein